MDSAIQLLNNWRQRCIYWTCLSSLYISIISIGRVYRAFIPVLCLFDVLIEPLYQCNIYWTCLSSLYASAISIDLLIGLYTVAIYVLLMQYSLDVLTALYNTAISHWTIVRRFPAVPNSENFNMDQLHNPDDEYYSPRRVPVELYRTRNIFNGSSTCQSVQFFTSNSPFS